MDLDVKWEDQKIINSFAVKNSHQEVLKEKIAQLKEKISLLDSTLEELELVLEDNLMYKVGDVFIKTPNGEIENFLQKEKSDCVEALQSLEEEKIALDSTLAEYKIALYGKFGRDNINLEA